MNFVSVRIEEEHGKPGSRAANPNYDLSYSSMDRLCISVQSGAICRSPSVARGDLQGTWSLLAKVSKARGATLPEVPRKKTLPREMTLLKP